ncbi:glycosyltransferase family 1 protein [Curtobacterium albidum]|uniref:Glycosyltransferase family 1 protein n=1 Tax=Curtobacterium citreum TaxID=2036 RepID=A0A850DSV8_9MICO|nr:glycosyltransferase [Curtobacterium albidum]NUU28031.1 glycosyltransferase family 1 protein [Curtobacterium albidum]
MALFGRRRRPVATDPAQEARPASGAAASVVSVVGWRDPLPHTSEPVTVVVTTRSDRHGAVAGLVATARAALGADATVRAVSYVADASPVDPFEPDLPWVRDVPVAGFGSAVNAGVAPGVGRTLVLVDTSVDMGPEALHALATAVDAPLQALVHTVDGAARHGARLLRPGALPWSDDRSGAPSGPLLGADQPAVSVPRTALVPAPCLPDERTVLTAWTDACARSAGATVMTRDVGRVVRTVEPGRTVDAAVVDVVSSWRDSPADPVATGGVAAGPPLPPWGARPGVPEPARADDGAALSWSLKIAAPAGAAGDGWGDVHFADELAAALRRLGQRVRVDRRDAHVRDDDASDDVTVVVRGLDRVPPNPASVNLLWVISHPDDVEDTELRSFDGVFAAGPTWAAAAAARAGVPVRTLLQATDPSVFRPTEPRPSSSPPSADAGRVVFVGSTRGVSRPIVARAAALGTDLTVHGPGWDALLPARMLGEPSLDRAAVAATYSSARVVLNDHWPDMALGGFVSNRVFDVLAAGGVVVTDPVAGLEDLLDLPTLGVAADERQLAALLDPAHAWPGPEERSAVAALVAAEHSFDARAAVLLETAREERVRLGRG